MADKVAYWFVLAVLVDSHHHVLRLGPVRAGAVLDLCGAQCGGGADHRLSRARWDWRRRCRSWSPPAAPRRSACCSAMPRRSKHLRTLDTLVVDKTGTLTEGKPAFRSVLPMPGIDATRCCDWRPAWTRAANIRWPRRSWPKRAGVRFALSAAPDFDSRHRAGRARHASTGAALLLGNSVLMSSNDIDIDALDSDAEDAAQGRRQRDVPGRRWRAAGPAGSG